MGASRDPRDRLIVALDTPSLPEAEALADRLAGAVRWFKIGPQLFTPAGPAAVAAIRRRGEIFLDLKFHDIPSTVAAGVAAAARLGVSLCNVHALGGRAMIEAASRAARETRMRVIAVTLLTSGDAATLEDIGVREAPAAETLRLARLAQAGGLDGVVAPPLDAAAVRKACGPEFLIVSPGIRPMDGDRDDQRRTDTPAAAVAAGADMLVVGRAIIRADDPRRVVEEIIRQIAGP
ncbi:MAG TPA: orotidine-5'-phosphate decarboxylase [bacterium]|nr:orotidine-5'-phosphate decarboxylase [bacterium]